MLQSYNTKNDNLKVYIGGEILHRDKGGVSVFDSLVQGGDGVWEGLRLYKEGIFCLDRHLNRMLDSAKALAFNDIPSKDELKAAIKLTLESNNMVDDVHIRLTLSRGEKITSGMDPRLNQKGSCIIVLAEHKPLVYDNTAGIKVISSSMRRNAPQFLDSKIHHNNLLNNILAKIQANVAGVDAAIMLDNYGFVSELNDTNLFMAKEGVLYTPHADACLHGITRGLVIELARENNIEIIEKNLSLTEFYAADEVFGTGTMGELTPVIEIDGRSIANNARSNVKGLLDQAFREKIPRLCEAL